MTNKVFVVLQTSVNLDSYHDNIKQSEVALSLLSYFKVWGGFVYSRLHCHTHVIIKKNPNPS